MKRSFTFTRKFNFVVLIGVLLLASCSKEDNFYAFEEDLEVTRKIHEFRSTFASIKTEVKASANLGYQKEPSGDEIDDFVRKMFHPSLELIQAYGISTTQLKWELGTLDPALVVLAAEIIYNSELTTREGYSLKGFENHAPALSFLQWLGIQSVYAQSDTIGGCLADAIGITAAFEVIDQGIAGLGKKGVLKILKKVGGKYLGVIGVGLAAYDFADCMDWI